VTSRGPIGSLPEALGVSWIARGPFFHASQPDTVAAGTLAGRGVTVHAALTGPTDTDMSRGFDIPKASADSVARGIFDGVEDGEEDIFPIPCRGPWPRAGARRDQEPESFVPLLERIRDLLLKHDFLAQATVVAGLIDLAHLEDPSFADRLGGGGLWGSAGSVADIVDLRRSQEPVDPETERDSVQLIHALIQLGDDMRAQGIA
jgi:hypothetical protein